MIGDYLDALVKEIDETFEIINTLGMRVTTVYIGGGTPTTLDADQLERLLSKVEEQEQKLPVDELVEEAFATLESFYIRAKF